MTIPRLKFVAATLSESVNSIHGFLNPYKNEWDWSDIIYQEYPAIENKIKGIKKIRDRKTAELAFFKQYIKTRKIDLIEISSKFQASWDKVGSKVFTVLSDIVEEDWTKIPKEIIAHVSLNPINPRNIQKSSFDIFFKYTPAMVKSTATHEILHFIYFKKWQKVFPKTKNKELDAPYLAWHLSEMVSGIILNDKQMQAVFKHNFHSYDIYEQTKLNGKPLLSFIQKIYDNRSNFEDFLKKSWKFVLEHDKFIRSL